MLKKGRNVLYHVKLYAVAQKGIPPTNILAINLGDTYLAGVHRTHYLNRYLRLIASEN